MNTKKLLIYGGGILIFSFLLICTVLLFTRKRVVYEDKVVTLIREYLPNRIEARFGPAEPDSVYPEIVMFEEELQELLVSQKTFHKNLLMSSAGKPIVNITSMIKSYGIEPAKLISNDIDIFIDRDVLIEEVKSKLPPESKIFWKGFWRGAGITFGVIGVGTSIYLIATG